VGRVLDVIAPARCSQRDVVWRLRERSATRGEEQPEDVAFRLDQYRESFVSVIDAVVLEPRPPTLLCGRRGRFASGRSPSVSRPRPLSLAGSS
jgi:hypothetical protein